MSTKEIAITLVSFRRVRVDFRFSDVPADILGATYTLNWGDGSAAVSGSVWAGQTYSFTHTYAHGATFPITSTVTDKDGGSTSETIFASVP